MRGTDIKITRANQSHHGEVVRWEIFMEQELRLGWIWAGSATFEARVFMGKILKKQKTL